MTVLYGEYDDVTHVLYVDPWEDLVTSANDTYVLLEQLVSKVEA